MSLVSEVLQKAKKVVEEFQLEPQIGEIGYVREIRDGIAVVEGLQEAFMGEKVLFEGEVVGQVFSLEKDSLQCIIFGDYTQLHTGSQVFRSGEQLTVPAGEELLGRTINPLGRAIDGREPISCKGKRPIFFEAPPITARRPVRRTLFTGIKTIDAVIPLGKGQRELIIGDRRTGKTSIAFDIILNQRGKNVICIYVAIGQKLSVVKELVENLKRYQAIDYSIVVCASSEDPPAMVYLAPYSGCAIAEYFMYGGYDTLIVYDDLTKHAASYRSLSLLMKRPPGRESYPGDIFYIHSSLLERSAQLSEKYGGGSMTALPVIETQEGDISAYIPTNLISITDGQIYLESALLARGFGPPVNVGLSVSRVGGEAQTPIMKKIARRVRLDLSQYFELEEFARFSADLDEVTQKQLNHGKRVFTLLSQPPFSPLDIALEILVIFAATRGLVDEIPLEKMREWETLLCKKAIKEKPDLLERLRKDRDLSMELEERMRDYIQNFNQLYLEGRIQ